MWYGNAAVCAKSRKRQLDIIATRHITRFLYTALLVVANLPFAVAQTSAYTDGASATGLTHSVRYDAEVQFSCSDNRTPLWLNANKYGLSSLSGVNGYARLAVSRQLSADSARHFGMGYGIDVVAPLHYTSSFFVQQAYVEGRWLHGVLTVGSRQYPMQLKNNALSSGSQTLGINARPVPQVRVALPDYVPLPFTRGWLAVKGHIAYGKMTDGAWQRDFTSRQSKYTEGLLFHSKAGYLRFGNENTFSPLSVELGLEMASLFGGTAYRMQNGRLTAVKGETGLKAFWHAFIPGGADAGETVYQNISGDMVGSWLARVNYETDTWKMALYADKFFEDQSGMFYLDKDGYGTGEKWNKQTKHRFVLYDFKDIMLGAEFNLKYGRWLRDVVVEYLYTKYQSGPVYHDHTQNLPDHIGGDDNFYNHYIYPGWQHWGQVLGNPLYRSPVYNGDGSVEVKDSRFVAWHIGASGQPTDRLGYRVLATWQKGWGTYQRPYTKPHHNVSFLVETTLRMRAGWAARGAFAMDFGHILGHNAGFQLTVSKSGWISR